MKTKLLFLCIIIFTISCEINKKEKSISTTLQILNDSPTKSFDSFQKTIHVFVALCDNKYQGIVPVPPKIGNGQDPDNNLYWGCSYGIRSYFKKSKNWKLLKKYSIDSVRLERLVFKHTKFNYYLIADAYNGKEIRKCTIDFLSSCAGILKETLEINNSTIGISGNSNLVSYIGHDGLMDFQLTEKFTNKDNKVRNAIILACISKKYFGPHLANTKANPLVWSTGLMSPEAYTLHDALESYISNESPLTISLNAAKAYSKYQKCSEKAARRLLVSGY